MNEAEARSLLSATRDEVRDDDGTLLGLVTQAVRVKVDRPYLAMGGFLVVTRDEATDEYVGTEFDALPHPRTGKPYPAGHSERVWTASSLEAACRHMLAYFEPENR